MFSQKKFIDASRSFVCIRIETYENKKSEEMVRDLLNGRFANTAFCVFNPQGTKRLSRAGRSPNDLAGRRRGDDNAIIAEMQRIASNYKSRGEKEGSVLQDFNTFRQALNVASGDQRLLVFVNAQQADARKITPTLQAVFADKDITGKFHLDLADTKDTAWAKSVKGSVSAPGINIIRAGKFGVDGTVMKRLPLTASAEAIKDSLTAANREFAATEKRKSYGSHVMEGKRKQIYFKNEIPYGEDRDGDGKADKRRGGEGSGRPGGGGGRRGGKGRRP
ncbi:MAG: hypothetical protein AB8G99_05955 [Planctomycetaceae bacterium]